MKDKQLLFILRIPADASSGVKNPTLTVSYGGKLDHSYQLKFPVTLEPGQYISLPHQFPVACVYDAKGQVLREVEFNDMPTMDAGAKLVRARISCEPLVPGAKVDLHLNIRFQETIKNPDHAK